MKMPFKFYFGADFSGPHFFPTVLPSVHHSRGTANFQAPSPRWWSRCIARRLCCLLCHKWRRQDLVQQTYLVIIKKKYKV